MKNDYSRIGSYRFSTPDGHIETFVLERNSSGDLRLKNEFGNITIETDLISGYEFFKKIYQDVETECDLELLASLDSEEESDDKKTIFTNPFSVIP